MFAFPNGLLNQTVCWLLAYEIPHGVGEPHKFSQAQLSSEQGLSKGQMGHWDRRGGVPALIFQRNSKKFQRIREIHLISKYRQFLKIGVSANRREILKFEIPKTINTLYFNDFWNFEYQQIAQLARSKNHDQKNGPYDPPHSLNRALFAPQKGPICPLEEAECVLSVICRPLGSPGL